MAFTITTRGAPDGRLIVGLFLRFPLLRLCGESYRIIISCNPLAVTTRKYGKRAPVSRHLNVTRSQQRTYVPSQQNTSIVIIHLVGAMHALAPHSRLSPRQPPGRRSEPSASARSDRSHTLRSACMRLPCRQQRSSPFLPSQAARNGTRTDGR